MLLLSLIHALVGSAALHKKLSVPERLENSMTCHTLLDMAKLLSMEHEDQHGLPRSSAFMAPVTMRNLQDTLGYVGSTVFSGRKDLSSLKCSVSSI